MGIKITNLSNEWVKCVIGVKNAIKSVEIDQKGVEINKKHGNEQNGPENRQKGCDIKKLT